MGPAGNGRSESKGFVDTCVQELHPHKAFLICRIFSTQKHGIYLSPETFIVYRVGQEVVPQSRERHGGGIGTVTISINISCGWILNVDREKHDIPCNHRSEPFDNELRLGPSHSPLPVFAALGNNQHSPLSLGHGDAVEPYKMEHEVSRHRPALNSLVHDDVADVNSGESQPNEIDKLVEPSRGPWNVRNDAQYADVYV